MLIDASYFVGEIDIPNTDQDAVSQKVNWMIRKYEPELLKTILGLDLYTAFAEGIKANPVDQKWTDIKNRLITVDNTTNDIVFKQSLIANYVYYWWQRSNGSLTTGTGEVQGNDVSPAYKMCRAWNEFVDWLRETVSFLNDNKDTYPDWDSSTVYVDCYGNVTYWVGDKKTVFGKINPFF